MSFPLMPVVSPSSNPGVEWTPVGSIPTVVDFRQISVSPGGTWVAARNNSTSISRSTDYGSSWSSVSVPSAIPLGGFIGAAYGVGLFVISEKSTQIHSSPDGLTWTRRTTSPSERLSRMTFNDGYFVVGTESSSDSAIYASSNGTSWSFNPQGTFPGSVMNCGIYVGALNRTFADSVSDSKYVDAVPTSSTSWTGNTTGISGDMYDVSWSPVNSLAVGVGANGIFSSSDLITWTRRVAVSNFYGVSWCATQFVAVGSAGKIYTSPNGVTWTSRTSGTANNLYGVAEQGGVILVSGDSGTVLRSVA
jgi:hypothetical protein